jgi:hypothetical protein
MTLPLIVCRMDFDRPLTAIFKFLDSQPYHSLSILYNDDYVYIYSIKLIYPWYLTLLLINIIFIFNLDARIIIKFFN